ncbi:hypothetical protein PAJ34TS1_45180 [Paenibacillus azoreducens]
MWRMDKRAIAPNQCPNWAHSELGGLAVDRVNKLPPTIFKMAIFKVGGGLLL